MRASDRPDPRDDPRGDCPARPTFEPDAYGGVTVVLDAALMEHAVINTHPLTNTMTTSIARDDLVKFLESTGHPPRIIGVAGPYEGPD